MLLKQETQDVPTLIDLGSATPWSLLRIPLQSRLQRLSQESPSARSLHRMVAHSMCDILSLLFRSDWPPFTINSAITWNRYT